MTVCANILAADDGDLLQIVIFVVVAIGASILGAIQKKRQERAAQQVAEQREREKREARQRAIAEGRHAEEEAEASPSPAAEQPEDHPGLIATREELEERRYAARQEELRRQQARREQEILRRQQKADQQRVEEELRRQRRRAESLEKQRQRRLAMAAPSEADTAAIEARLHVPPEKVQTVAAITPLHLSDADTARQAMIYHEIFSPPKALRTGGDLWDM